MNRYRAVISMALGVAGAALVACRADAPHENGPSAYTAEVAKAVPLVEQAVGLKFKHAPKVESRTRAEVHQFLDRQMADTRNARDLDGEEASLKLLGLIPDTMHLRREFEDLLTEQIMGFYDPETKVLYIVDSAPPAEVTTTIDHELVHALQDQYINLDSIEKVENEDDRTSAADAVIEGQAVFEQLAVANGSKKNFIAMLPGGWDRVRQMIRDNQSSMPTFSNAPMILQETMIFPYLSGAEFMRHFVTHEPGKQPYDSLMPTSTKQILHPETAFFGKRDLPTRVTLPAVPRGDSLIYQNTLGEFQTRLFIFQHLGDQKMAIDGAAGWEGDRYEVVQTPDGSRTFVWVTIWDTPVDGAGFHDLALQANATRARGRPSRRVTVTPIEIQGRAGVLYVDAPTSLENVSALINPAAIKLSLEH